MHFIKTDAKKSSREVSKYSKKGSVETGRKEKQREN